MRRLGPSLVVVAVALFVGAVPNVAAAPGRSSAHLAAASYANASIATTALKYVGRWGGYACADAHRSGETASASLYPDYPPGASAANPPKPGARINPDGGGDGQCRSFVNCIVWIASGHTQWLGFDPSDYFYAFTHPQGGGPPGVEITSVSQLTEGDIVQIGNGTHTFIIVAPAPAATDTPTTKMFTVVDSNYDLDEYVHEHTIAVTLSSTERAFHMGSATAVGQPPSPTQQATGGTNPGATDSQQALILLQRYFPAESDEIRVVFSPASGSVDARPVRLAIGAELARLGSLPIVRFDLSPYGPSGATQISANRRVAFAIIGLDKQPQQIPAAQLQSIIAIGRSAASSTLEVQLSGPAVSQAAGASEAYDMLASGFGSGFNGPLQIVATLSRADDLEGVVALREVFVAQRGVTAVTRPQLDPAGEAVTFTVYPTYSPQSPQTAKLLATLRAALARFHKATGVDAHIADVGAPSHAGGST